MSTPYDKEYYLGLREGSRRSAEVIVPLVCGWIHPGSVVDVGCGDGTWLSVFRQHGVREILGIDREYVTGEILQIPEEKFLRHDLRVPLSMDRVFDLVVSLEVAEHLPAEFAETFVDSLARLGPAILFSAAVPFQGGADHFNEQWPDYWVDLFRKKGFVARDPIRKQIWKHADIEWWYSQNILMFMKREYLEERPELQAEWKDTRESQLSIVHPRTFMEMARKHMEAFRKYEIFSAEAENNREEADRQRRTAEHYVAEADRYREEAATQCEEAAAQRKDAAEQRAKAEHYIAEADRYREEAAEQRAKAQPRNMSLKEVVKALPAILAGAFRRMRNRGRIAKPERSDES